MTFPTAEDIKFLEVFQHEFLTIDITNNRGIFESLKQQILSEHEIVERLKVIFNKLYRDGDYDYKDAWHLMGETKLILENN